MHVPNFDLVGTSKLFDVPPSIDTGLLALSSSKTSPVSESQPSLFTQ